MAGVELPIVPMKHAYVVSEPMAGVRGMPNVRDHDWSVYFRVQGESLCVGGYESNPVMLDNVSPEFSFGLYELDWTVFSSHVQVCSTHTRTMHRLPILHVFNTR